VTLILGAVANRDGVAVPIAIVSAAHNLLASGGALGDLGTHRFQS
jgi:hypothetical protein